jgi:hypothetical protein
MTPLMQLSGQKGKPFLISRLAQASIKRDKDHARSLSLTSQ